MRSERVIIGLSALPSPFERLSRLSINISTWRSNGFRSKTMRMLEELARWFVVRRRATDVRPLGTFELEETGKFSRVAWSGVEDWSEGGGGISCWWPLRSWCSGVFKEIKEFLEHNVQHTKFDRYLIWQKKIFEMFSGSGYDEWRLAHCTHLRPFSEALTLCGSVIIVSGRQV